MILKRLRDITTATVNDVLDRVEDPVAMLNQYLRDMEEEISKAELAITRQSALEKKWFQEREEAKQMVDKRIRQARLAVEAKEDELARRALREKMYYEQKYGEYSALYEETKKQSKQLSESLSELKDKFYEMRNKKYALMARANAAKATQNMSVAVQRFDTVSAEKGFNRIEKRVLEMEAGADSMKAKRYYTTEERFRQLETNDEVEKELLELKKSIEGE